MERSHNAQKELGFLGMRIGFSGDGDLECHQILYVKSCLKERGFSDLRGSQSLPNIQEGMQPEFDDRNCDEYRGLLRKGQQEIGGLLWASQRTRPDMAAVIGVLGSMLVTHPRKVVDGAIRFGDTWQRLLNTRWCLTGGQTKQHICLNSASARTHPSPQAGTKAEVEWSLC